MLKANRTDMTNPKLLENTQRDARDAMLLVLMSWRAVGDRLKEHWVCVAGIREKASAVPPCLLCTPQSKEARVCVHD